MADFHFARATRRWDAHHQTDANAQLAHVGGGPFGRRPPSPSGQTGFEDLHILSLWRRAKIADAAVIKMRLATLSLAMVREIQNAT